MHTYYLLDHDYSIDEKGGTMGHLLAFNPGSEDASLAVTVFYPDREPTRFTLRAPAGQSSESNYANWPIEPRGPFALMVESDKPLVCQSTVGWNNQFNDYSPKPGGQYVNGVRECAKSYMAISALAKDWYLADGIVIDMPDKIWVRESEWAVLLNPGDEEAVVTASLYYSTGLEERSVKVAPRRLLRLYMDEIARRNAHYGARFVSDRPIAAQWLRAVYWSDRPDLLMTYWTVPCVPGPLA